MSIFLFYFDEGSLTELAGTRGSLVLHPSPRIVRYAGTTLTRQVVSITDGVASESLRHSAGAAGASMHRDLALLVVERLLHSHTPRLLFHVAGESDETVEAVGHVQLTVIDLFVRVARVETGGRSGSQGHGEESTRSITRPDIPELTGAEGDVGSLGDIIAMLPYDTLVTVGGPPRTGADWGSGRRKRGKMSK